MKFCARHTFRRISLADYEKLYFDEAFCKAMTQATRLTRVVERCEVQDDRITRVVRIGPQRELPAVAAKFLGATRLEYTEHLDFRFAAHRATFHTTSPILPDKVETRGTVEFCAVAGGVTRIVTGEFTVRLLGVGGVIERLVVDDVLKSYDAAAQFTQNWIDTHPQR